MWILFGNWVLTNRDWSLTQLEVQQVQKLRSQSDHLETCRLKFFRFILLWSISTTVKATHQSHESWTLRLTVDGLCFVRIKQNLGFFARALHINETVEESFQLFFIEIHGYKWETWLGFNRSELRPRYIFLNQVNVNQFISRMFQHATHCSNNILSLFN